jgi:hypothetical protein
MYITRTLHGHSDIKSKKIINLFGFDLTFFEIEELSEYDMILGEQGLEQMRATLSFSEYKLYYEVPKEQKMNYTNDNLQYEREISQLMKNNDLISEKLPFTTTIEATIRTKPGEPIWTKQYPYPYADKNFVDDEIENLLENNIIEKSFSPYNAPIWVVPKKGIDSNGKPKRRLVIDFQKLNDQTITDKYPIPDINMTIQNLGKAKVFSTVDLESGFHQILIKEEDREKTAFSVNHAKFQFRRMPFGLKNAPAIFQRCVNDILHEYIGKFAYVYIDDVLIFSNTHEEHLNHISIIFKALNGANMKISNEKSHFFKNEIEFLGHIIKHNKITVDPEKITTIRDYEIPSTLKQLRSFLGLAGYYRKFIKDYAQITKPLTLFLRGENGSIKANKSSKIEIKLDEAGINAFEKVKILLQEKVELYQPDYTKPFELTTDASNYAIGAVLSQERHPITFISRTLNSTEQNYATNEKEILAIVWALQKLRNYLYGIANLTIYTDHQSLIHSISEKNPNTKLKRWKNFIAEFGADIKYKPGLQNVVADALSRHQVNNMTDNSTDDLTVHSIDSSPKEFIKTVSFPLNRFKNQIEIEQSDVDTLESKTTFYNHENHKIKFKNNETLILNLKKIILNNRVNAIFCSSEIFYLIEKFIFDAFPNANFVYTTTKVINVTNLTKQLDIVEEIHNRAHRNARNNYEEARREYYWPKMIKDFRKWVNGCEICKTQKYERMPTKQLIVLTPIPIRVGESISMDLFYIDNKQYVTSVDRYSKYLLIHMIESKVNFRDKLEEILTQNYPNCKYLITDNEAVLVSNAAKIIYNKYNITHITAPIQHSTSNGQVERTHSTLIEIIRCLKTQNQTDSSDEIYNSAKAYNETIHSVTGERPVDVKENPTKYRNISERLLKNQATMLKFHNKNRQNRDFEVGETVYVKGNRRRKDADAYRKHIVRTNLKNTIRTTQDKLIHKDSLRNTLKNI